MQPNWIPDRNPFNLATPPKWFLDEMAAFDADLVLIPSRYQPVYRLMRRTKHTAGFKFVADMAKGMEIAADTKMAALYGVMPVTTLYDQNTWSSQVFSILARRDIWRVGGAEKANEIIETAEKKQESAVETKINDELNERVNRSYESYRYRTGQRLSMTTPSAPVRKPPQAESSTAAVS